MALGTAPMGLDAPRLEEIASSPFGRPRNDKIMTHSLSITYGSTTITLALVDYTPTSALASVAEVTERWEVHVTGASKALLQAAIHEIERAFELARQHQANSFLDRVFLNFQPVGYEESYRSQILDGKIDFYDETLKWAWANAGFDVRLTITRQNFWEGAEAEIPLSNSNGEGVTDGIIIYNCNDGEPIATHIRENWVDIDAADLEGDIPAPLKVKLTAGGNGIQKPILVLNNSGGLADLTHMAECEDVAASTDTDSTCSGGEYGFKEFATVDEDVSVFFFDHTSTFKDLEIGRWYLPFLRLQSIPTIEDLWTRISLVYGLTQSTQYIRYPASDGPPVIQYPPIKLGLPNLATPIFSLGFYFKTSTAGTKLIAGDFIYMLPIDGVRFYDVNLSGSRGYDSLVDDPYENAVYKINVVTYDGGYQQLLSKGNPLMVDPRHDARLYYLATGGGTARIGYWGELFAYYRPRRLAL